MPTIMPSFPMGKISTIRMMPKMIPCYLEVGLAPPSPSSRPCTSPCLLPHSPNSLSLSPTLSLSLSLSSSPSPSPSLSLTLSPSLSPHRFTPFPCPLEVALVGLRDMKPRMVAGFSQPIAAPYLEFEYGHRSAPERCAPPPEDRGVEIY